MRTLLAASLLLALLAAPASAQLAGGNNRSAPTVTQKVTFFGDAGIGIEYRAINFAKGAFLERLKGNAEFRARINELAPRSPLGKVTVARGVAIGGHAVAAGTYSLYFLVGDEMGWTMVLAPAEGEAVKVPLALKEVDRLSKRLELSLGARESDEEAGLTIAFGNVRGELVVKEAAN